MKIFAAILLIISLTKLFIISGDRQVELKKLVSRLPIHSDLIDPTIKVIIVFDGLIGLICGLIIIFVI